MDQDTERAVPGNSPLAVAMQAEAAAIAAAHPHILTRKSAVDWTRAAAEFELSAVMWHAMADSARDYGRPDLGHLAEDFGQQIAGLYRRMAQIAESFQDQARCIAFAEAHTACEDDCDVPA